MKKHPLFILIFLFAIQTHAQPLVITDAKQTNLTHWQTKSFAGETTYQLIKEDNKPAIKAIANDSASGIYKEIKIDLKKYPYLNWQWKITNHLKTKNERSKKGDDYSARIYVIKSGGLFFWKTLSLNYVWANNEAKDALWPNAFAPNNAKMLAVRNKQDPVNTWFTEKTNVYQDLKIAFGETITQIDGIAIMTDTDNTGGKAEAFYSNIYFSQN